MSVLSRSEIIFSIEHDEISFDPEIDQFQLSPIAVDLRVGNNFFVPKLSSIAAEGRIQFRVDHLDNTKNCEIFDQIHLDEGQFFELLPGEFILISSLEKISIKSGEIMAMLFPRSSTSRRGLSMESGIVDPFYSGFLTIPIINSTKTEVIKIYPGERIMQLVFQRIGSKLSKDETLSHGLSQPKYQGTKSYMVDYKFDPHEEISLIRSGDLDSLKSKFNLKMGVGPKKKKEQNVKKKIVSKKIRNKHKG